MEHSSGKFDYLYPGKIRVYWKPVTERVEKKDDSGALRILAQRSKGILDYLSNGQLTATEAERYFEFINDYLEENL